jgi:acyl-CoA synthetase (AMP-forming)/AMP-acid ligase II
VDGLMLDPQLDATRPAKLVDEAVREHVAQRPDTVAVTGTRVSLTWRQLDLAAGRGAAIIAATGGPGSRVAWLGQNDLGYPITLLAAWRQRSGVVGLNWRLPDADVGASCAEVQVTHLFTSAAFEARAREIAKAVPGVHVEVVDEAIVDHWPGTEPVEALDPQPGDPGLVFFTSGSTGVPKAVSLTRFAVEQHATVEVVHGFDSDSVFLIVPPVFHLAGCTWVQYALFYGGRQVFLAEASPAAIIDGMASEQVTHAVYVPTLIRALVDELRANPRPLPAFRHMAYGASPIPVPLLREAVEVFGCEMCQVFGMTESGGVVTVLPPEDHRLDAENPERIGSAGIPPPGVQLEVRDPGTGEPVATGESGVLWFRTPFMSHGYNGRPEQTAEVFVDGWINSRDVGHLDADGYVYVEGRSDDMIITGGENVHPGEIENVLAEIPDVLEAAVLGLPDEHWGRRVAAAVVARTPDLTEEAVIAHCRSRLAGYKVPRTVVFLDELPKTATGKITRSGLEKQLVTGDPQ